MLYGINKPSGTREVLPFAFTYMSKAFADALKAKLAEKGMRPAELARRSGVTKQNIGRIIHQTPHHVTGAPPKVERETVAKLAAALDWDIDDALLVAGYAPTHSAGPPRDVPELMDALARLGFPVEQIDPFHLEPDQYEALLKDFVFLLEWKRRNTLN